MKYLKRVSFTKLLITNYQLLVILLLAAFFRFAGLSWGLPYHFHPDEWNMAAAITRLSWQNYLNPEFWAYGQFPLYLAWFSSQIYNLLPWIKIKAVDTAEAIFFLRFWSSTAGVATVYLVYLISKKFLTLTTQPRPTTHNSQLTPLLAALLAALTPGLIQISHFGTTESLLSFFLLLILLYSFKILEEPKLRNYIFLGIVLGLSIGTKISALIFGLPVFLVFILNFAKALKNKNKIENLGKLFLKNLTLLSLLSLLTLLVSPYLFLAYKESRGTLLYEASVATGKSLVFYTRQFINTPPITFQLEKIFPYTLGWPIFILGSLGLLLLISALIKNLVKRKFLLIANYYLLITLISFLTYFLSQAFLFAKWTRFMAPIFAFFPIFAVLSLSYLSNLRYLRNLLVVLAIIPGIVFSSIYLFPDIRFTASDWIYKNIPANSQILFDTGNVVDIPISPPSHQSPITNYPLVSFDFYHLDENPELFPKLLNYLENSDYIIVPSRRVFSNHIRLPETYPLTAEYYGLLFSGKLGFTQIAKIEPFYSKIFKDEQAEETFTVFDHPTIRIYKKTVKLLINDYENLFQ